MAKMTLSVFKMITQGRGNRVLNLASMATDRALTLKQPQDPWVEAVRQPVFNDFSSLVTDGEIEKFIAACEHPEVLVICAGIFVDSHNKGSGCSFEQILETVKTQNKGRNGF